MILPSQDVTVTAAAFGRCDSFLKKHFSRQAMDEDFGIVKSEEVENAIRAFFGIAAKGRFSAKRVRRSPRAHFALLAYPAYIFQFI